MTFQYVWIVWEVLISNNLDYVLLSRSLLARDPKGHLTAGIYFPIKKKDQQFTMFFDCHNGKQRKKLKFESFLELQKVSFTVLKYH